jgi:ABC-type nitrate/sulfonate/bicarbonate transport system ATPase subunit
MNLELDLTRHCIETELKRRNNAAISRYFKAGDGKADMEETLALLEQAIRAFDFQSLRNRWPALSGGAGLRVVLVRDDAGNPMLSFENRFIIPPANLL